MPSETSVESSAVPFHETRVFVPVPRIVRTGAPTVEPFIGDAVNAQDVPPVAARYAATVSKRPSPFGDRWWPLTEEERYVGNTRSTVTANRPIWLVVTEPYWKAE